MRMHIEKSVVFWYTDGLRGLCSARVTIVDTATEGVRCGKEIFFQKRNLFGKFCFSGLFFWFFYRGWLGDGRHQYVKNYDGNWF